MAHLPVSRIKTIMKSSADVENVSKEATYVVTRATEAFIKLIAQEAHNDTGKNKKLDYKNLSNVVHDMERYEFLREIIPKKITVAQYKALMIKLQRRQNNEPESDSSDDESSGGSSNNEESSSDESTNANERNSVPEHN